MDDDSNNFDDDDLDDVNCGCRCCMNRAMFGFCACQWCEGLWDTLEFEECIEEAPKECSCVYCSSGEKDKCLSKAWGSI